MMKSHTKRLILWASALTLGCFVSDAALAAATCKVTYLPEAATTTTVGNPVLVSGQTISLRAECQDSSNNPVSLATVTWEMCNTPSSCTWVPITDKITITPPAGAGNHNNIVYLKTPVAGKGTYLIGLDATGTVASTPATITASPADALRVTVQPVGAASLMLNQIYSKNYNTPAPASPVDGACGGADKTSVTSMPTSTSACSAGVMSMAIADATGFYWTCASANGGASSYCHAINSTAPAVTTTTSTPSGSTSTPSGSTGTPSSSTSSPTVASSDTLGYGGGPLEITTSDGRNVYVEDQATWDGPVQYIPGCLGGGSTTNSSTGCALAYKFPGFTTGTSYVDLSKSTNELAIRLETTAGTSTNMSVFKLEGRLGYGVGTPMSIWLTQDPTASYSATSSSCKASGTNYPIVGSGGTGLCPVSPNAGVVYYLKIRADNGCSNCSFKVDNMGYNSYVK